ncbi:peptidoglycan DD-metalloendopeptidase family protein [bacterium]|nr:peptidoglycan DD-metalloendopeptidase family protein [bacterium]
MKQKLILFIIVLLLSACSFNKGRSEGFIYVVKSGDTLSKISSQYNISVSTIKYYNDKYYDDLIIGERLFIPLPDHELAQKENIIKDNKLVEKEFKTIKVKDGLVYRVQSGDNLYRISRNFGITVSQIKDLNSLDSDLISIDQELYIKKFDSKKTQKKKIEVAEKRDKIAEPKVSKSKAPATPYTSPNAGEATSFPQEWKDAFLLPVSGRLSSPFGMRGGRLHKGVDITAPPGTEIKVAFSGTVTYTGFLRDYGNVIIVEHGKEVVTVYAHNEINLVKKSDKVNKGDVIARLGSTGKSSGPHLHFEIRVANKPIDPAKIISEINLLQKI